MYQFDWRASRGGQVGEGKPAVSSTVWFLGWTSLLTDVSSEMVNGILPLYLVSYLRLSPLQFGIIDGLYQGMSAVLRLVGGYLAPAISRQTSKSAAVFGEVTRELAEGKFEITAGLRYFEDHIEQEELSIAFSTSRPPSNSEKTDRTASIMRGPDASDGSALVGRFPGLG